VGAGSSAEKEGAPEGLSDLKTKIQDAMKKLDKSMANNVPNDKAASSGGVVGVGATSKEPPGGALKLSTEIDAVSKKFGAPSATGSSQDKQGGTSKVVIKHETQETHPPDAALSSEKIKGYLTGIVNTIKDAAVFVKDSSLSSPEENQKLRLLMRDLLYFMDPSLNK
jgi:hypothetical protein